jgi:putative ABC transport system substrate-binding protein
LQLLKEIDPRLNRVAVLWNPLDKGSTVAWKEIQQPARELGIALRGLEVSKAGDFDAAFEEATRSRVGALAIMPETLYVTHLKRIADFALNARLPSIFHLAEFAQAGGLVAYGPDRSDLFRRAATYVDKILKGAKPSELPVERPTKFQLVINLSTAKAIGITIPPSLLLRVDEVIQ